MGKLQSKTKITFGKNLGGNHDILRGDNLAINAKVVKVAAKGEKDSAGDPQPNTLIVNMIFHLEKPSKHNNLIEILPINIPGEILFGMTDNYLYNYNHKAQLEVVDKRHKLGFDKKYHKDEVQKNGPTHYEESYYNQKFHHSEQALYMYLSERSNLDSLASQLKNRGVLDRTKITGVNIDMHSIRYVCGNCEIGGFGLMHSQYDFKDKLAKALKGQNLELKDNAQFYLAAAAEKPDGKGESISKKNHLDINLDTARDVFIEADANAISIPIAETDLHRRTTFVSKKLKDNDSSTTLGKKYQTAITELKVEEYSVMISRGNALREQAKLNLSICSEPEEDPYSAQDLEEIADGFSLLALLEGTMPPNKNPKTIAIATQIFNERTEMDSEIQAEGKEINNVKSILLQHNIKHNIVSDLSLKVLQNMKAFVDAKEVRCLVKLLKNEHFASDLEILSPSTLQAINEQLGLQEFAERYNNEGGEFLDFLEEAHRVGLSLEENLEINFSLYAHGKSINAIAALYDNLDATEVEELYGIIGSQIADFNKFKLDDFADGRVIRYLTSSYDDDRLDFERLSEVYDKNQDMFWDIINDPEEIGADNIIEAYDDAERVNSREHNDSALGEEEWEEFYEEEEIYEDPYGRTTYELAVDKYLQDDSYDMEDSSSMYEEDYWG